MGLYLCVFADDVEDAELDGVEVGTYADFTTFREMISGQLEQSWGARFPILMNHVDSDGAWPPADSAGLIGELREIEAALASFAPIPLGGWQAKVADSIGHRPANLAECFVDVDGELLIGRLISLAELALERQRPIEFM